MALAAVPFPATDLSNAMLRQPWQQLARSGVLISFHVFTILFCFLYFSCVVYTLWTWFVFSIYVCGCIFFVYSQHILLCFISLAKLMIVFSDVQCILHLYSFFCECCQTGKYVFFTCLWFLYLQGFLLRFGVMASQRPRTPPLPMSWPSNVYLTFWCKYTSSATGAVLQYNALHTQSDTSHS